MEEVFRKYPIGVWIPNETEYRLRMLTRLLINFELFAIFEPE
jgi:hypothetical protein